MQKVAIHMKSCSREAEINASILQADLILSHGDKQLDILQH